VSESGDAFSTAGLKLNPVVQLAMGRRAAFLPRFIMEGAREQPWPLGVRDPHFDRRRGGQRFSPPILRRARRGSGLIGTGHLGTHSAPGPCRAPFPDRVLKYRGIVVPDDLIARAVRVLAEAAGGPARVILFGSRVRGHAANDSDVGICSSSSATSATGLTKASGLLDLRVSYAFRQTSWWSARRKSRSGGT
jgi:hypothetical protein